MTSLNRKLENRQLGAYKLLSLIGKGGMAEVWLATQLNLNRQVAVKVIPETTPGEGDRYLVERFRREAQAVAQLDHPSILPVIDYGSAEGYLYMVTPYVQGGSLQQQLERETLPHGATFSITGQILEGLSVAHQHGIIHRDLKPGNILLYPEGRAVIADFGVAKIENENLALTQHGMILGSPEYMAPEQFMGHADYRSDLYSLAVILYQLLTGKLPYSGSTAWEIGIQHLNNPLPLPHPLIPPALEPILTKALQKRPEDRFANTFEMSKAFHRAAGSLSPVEMQVRPPLPHTGQFSAAFPSKVIQNKLDPNAGVAPAPVPSNEVRPVASAVPVPNPSVKAGPVKPQGTAVPTPSSKNSLPPVSTGIELPLLGKNGLTQKTKRHLPVSLIIGTLALVLLAALLTVLFVVFSTKSSLAVSLATVPAVVRTTPGVSPGLTGANSTRPASPAPATSKAVQTAATLTTVARAASGSLKATLNPASGTAARGNVQLTDNGNGTVKIELSLSGLGEGRHSIQIHQGSCQNPTALKYELEPVEAGPEGTANVTQNLKATFKELSGDTLHLEVLNHNGEIYYTASCGDLQGG